MFRVHSVSQRPNLRHLGELKTVIPFDTVDLHPLTATCIHGNLQSEALG